VRILIADDSDLDRLFLQALLTSWDYQVETAATGAEAWEALRAPDRPRLAVLDWEMPGRTGPEVCQMVRGLDLPEPPYLLLLTVRQGTAATVTALESGANDFVTKPYDQAELAARLGVARRMLDLQSTLAQRVRDLEAALRHVQQLRDLLPICAWCKRVRNDQNYWQQVDEYFNQHAGITFTHGICPECQKQLM
jgi:DNA-binding response OmpR family regulator